MESVSRTFFENPVYLYVALGLAEVVLAIRWRERRTRRLALALLVPAVLAGCVFLLDYFVVTDREQIISASKEIARGFETGSMEAAEKYLDEKFGGFYRTKRNALDRGKRAIERYKLRLVKPMNVEVRVAGRRAEMSVTTVIEPGAGELAGQRFLLSWTVHWVKVTVAGKQVWRIGSATPDKKPGRYQ